MTQRTSHPQEDRRWESECLRKARGGDKKAWGELLQSYQGRVYGLVLRLVRHPTDAQELTQEAFVQALRSQDRFDPERPFRPWLFQIAVNVCRNFRRARARSEVPVDVVDDLRLPLWAERRESPEESFEKRELISRMERSLADLKYEDRELLLLRYTEDMAYAELEAVYDAPTTVLKMRVHRAMRRLRKAAEGALQ